MAECTPSEMMAQLDFWLVMLAFSIGTGVGLMCINNCAQIAEAKGEIHPQKFVTLVSVANTSGRMLGGTLSDIFQNHCPRPLCLALSLLLMGASQGGSTHCYFTDAQCSEQGHLIKLFLRWIPVPNQPAAFDFTHSPCFEFMPTDRYVCVWQFWQWLWDYTETSSARDLYSWEQPMAHCGV